MNPWDRWLTLQRAYCALERTWEANRSRCSLPLPRFMPTLELACMAYRLEARAPAPAILQTRLHRCLKDPRAAGLSPLRRRLLLFATAAALGMRERNEPRAQQLLSEAVALSRCVWIPGAWSPALGTPPELVDRVPVALLADLEEPVDPTGDPELPQPVRALVPHTTDQDWGLVPVWMVLEGVTHWELVVEEHLGWTHRQFATDPLACLDRLVRACQDPWKIAPVMQWLAAA